MASSISAASLWPRTASATASEVAPVWSDCPDVVGKGEWARHEEESGAVGRPLGGPGQEVAAPFQEIREVCAIRPDGHEPGALVGDQLRGRRPRKIEITGATSQFPRRACAGRRYDLELPVPGGVVLLDVGHPAAVRRPLHMCYVGRNPRGARNPALCQRDRIPAREADGLEGRRRKNGGKLDENPLKISCRRPARTSTACRSCPRCAEAGARQASAPVPVSQARSAASHSGLGRARTRPRRTSGWGRG